MPYADPEARRAYHKTYAERNKATISARMCEYNKLYYAANKNKFQTRWVVYSEANKDTIVLRRRAFEERLPLSLVASRHNLPQPSAETTEGELALLEILRYNTLTKRLIKEAKNEHPRRAQRND